MGEFPSKENQFKPGNPGGGRPKGTKNLSTIVQKLAADEKLAESLLDKKPGWWDNLPNKDAAHAIVVAMMIKAMGGDEKAATWFRKSGWGDKLDVGSSDLQNALDEFKTRLFGGTEPSGSEKS